MIGVVVSIGCLIWTFFTILVLFAAKDLYNFFQSLGFVIVAVGWVILLSIWPIYKKLVGDEEEW